MIRVVCLLGCLIAMWVVGFIGLTFAGDRIQVVCLRSLLWLWLLSSVVHVWAIDGAKKQQGNP